MEREPHLLLVDDDPEIQRLLKKFLSQYGFRITVAADGREMRKALDDWNIEMVILDIMLPGEDGFALCREIRTHSKIPIIMLTAVSEETDRILGLELGADDYLSKPFNPRELLARVRAILRRTDDGGERTQQIHHETIQFADWTLDLGARELCDRDGVSIHLSSGEYALLVTFLNHAQRTLSREQLVDITRGQNSIPFDRSIDIQVSRLRKKIEPDSKSPKFIKTIRGAGYQFCAKVYFS